MKTISISGLGKLQDKLRALGIPAEELTKVLERGITPIRSEISARVPIVTGRLRRSVLSFGLRPVASKRAAAMVLAAERVAPHLHLFAFGRGEVKPGFAKGKPTGKRVLFSAARGFGPARRARPLPGNRFFEEGVMAGRELARRIVRYDLEKKIRERA